MKTTANKILSAVTVLLLFPQCTEHWFPGADDRLDRALDLAGPNRHELEKVLYRYSSDPADSLKYKAAVFLIENMPGHSYYEGEQLDRYLEYYPLLRNMIDAGHEPEEAADSIVRKYGSLNLSQLEHQQDIRTVDSAYLCRNIEWAFKVWKEQPWGMNVTFDDFCEYVLPYRVGNEAPADWREDYYNEYNGVLDSLRRTTDGSREDPVQAARCIVSHINGTVKKYFSMSAPASIPSVGPEVVKLHSGTCREYVDFLMYVCRALGIPCAKDFMPVKGDDNAGHFWTAFWSWDGTPHYQDNEEPVHEVDSSVLYKAPKVKVYRYMYSHDPEMEKEVMSYGKENVADIFRDADIMDVTGVYSEHYLDTVDIPVSSLYRGGRSGTVCLAINYGLGWVPVDRAWRKGGRISFHGVNGGNILRLMSLKDGRYICLSDPFYLGYEGQIHFFRDDGNVRDITVFSKYPPAVFNMRMVGGVFEGSNTSDFSRKDTLHVIYRKPLRLYTSVSLTDTAFYRYVRYYGPQYGYCNVAEITFYDNDGKRLDGTLIGTPGSPDGRHGHENVFDGTTLTSFDYTEASGGWAGLDFGKPVRIGRIVYSPRNYDNYVRAGDRYELYYYSRGWKSAGQVTATADSILFRDVPSGVLYLLRNHTQGVQERVFAYKDGQQIWDSENEIMFPVEPFSEEVPGSSIAGMSDERSWEGKYILTYPGPEWYGTDYDDSKWETGTAPFSTPGQPTVATAFRTKDIWIRRHVRFDPDMIRGKTLILRYSYDDCIRIYVDGCKVAEASGWKNDVEQELPDSVVSSLSDGEAVIAVRGGNTDGEGFFDFGIYMQTQD